MPEAKVVVWGGRRAGRQASEGEEGALWGTGETREESAGGDAKGERGVEGGDAGWKRGGGGGRGAGTAPVREKPCVWEEREEVTEKGGGGLQWVRNMVAGNSII